MTAPLCTGAAHAQANTPPQTGDDIVVTGSRVATNGFSAPTPLTVLGEKAIERETPNNIADFVNKLPQFASSSTSQNTANNVSDGNAGVNNLNLRGIGPNRTLVLLDGVRIVPSAITGFNFNGGSVDINPFPDALIKQVDVVTGGASAAYGSDAISGVVNFVLDKEYTGIKGDVRGGISDYGDDASYRISLSAGTGFADGRGHLLVSGSYTHNDGVISNRKRDWLYGPDFYAQITNPNYTATNGQPFYLLLQNVGSSRYTPGGLIASGPLRGIDFGPGGSTRMFNYGSINDGSLMSGGDWRETAGAFQGYVGRNTSLNPEITRKNLFARASFDVTDNIEAYGQFIYANTKSFNYSSASTAANFTINADNPFIPASVQSQMTALGLSSFTMSKDMSSDLGLNAASTSRDFYQFVGGLNGHFQALGSEWKWEGFFTRSTSESHIRAAQNLIRPNFLRAIDVVTSPTTGAPICRSTLTDPGNGCIPYNPMGTGMNSQTAIDYISGTSRLDQKLAQNEASLLLRGSPVSTWAGPVSMAVGLEYRKLSVSGVSSPFDMSRSFYVGNFTPTQGSVHSTEQFAEILVPLAKDEAWARELSLNGAVRRTDYNTSGTVTTWKVGGTYRPIDDLTFRATRSRDIRAPNLGELFAAGQSGTANIRDPFNGNTTVPYINVAIGNPALRPEVADTTTAGVIVQPSFLPGFNASFDYFKINMKDMINNTSAQDSIDGCFSGNQAQCAFISRAADGSLTVYQTPQNTAFLRTDGFDMEASYQKPLSDIFANMGGAISIRGLASHRLHLTQQLPSGLTVEGAGVNAGSLLIAPKWSYNVTLAYDDDRISAAWTGRGFGKGVQNNSWVECTSGCPTSTVENRTVDNNRLPSAFYMDFNLTYHLKVGGEAKADIYFTVNNLADKELGGVPIIGYYPGSYEFLGRLFRAGVRFEL
ncbi:TonB-dependent siderophore receptor [Sphingobium sp.]|uniref:TonB-dependent receptor plug domain-containing protein n=1 Tax=Sphingobium sp. TaxID=1912891 RepID=UPI00261CDF7F|nr:TonB-dependent receptor [Sphingobium sp.]